MPRDKTESHKRIIEAAKQEFLEYGYAEASLRRIAAAANIQVGGLYKHFASKDALFESLVEPAMQGFFELYHTIETAYMDEAAMNEWENQGEAVRVMEYIYSHLDEFKLLILRSEGTRYEDFKHKAAKLEEESTLRFLDEFKANGGRVNDFDSTEFHLLSTAYVESFFQPLIHDLDKEAAMHYAKTLESFYTPAWKSWLGIRD
ncbi:MAG: TetR/AcrR family transcriptional regulator [Ruminococcus sp.]|nr:TetR/AcrR family transcriptional regulator [Ruminococcus sp.]